MLGQAGRGAQLPPTSLLLLGDRQRALQRRFPLSSAPYRQKHLAPQPIQLSFEKPLACRFCGSKRFVEQIEADLRLAEARVGAGKMTEMQRAPVRVLHGRISAAHELDPLSRVTALRQERALNETCPLLIIGDAVLDAVGPCFLGVSCGLLKIAS